MAGHPRQRDELTLAAEELPPQRAWKLPEQMVLGFRADRSWPGQVPSARVAS